MLHHKCHTRCSAIFTFEHLKSFNIDCCISKMKPFWFKTKVHVCHYIWSRCNLQTKGVRDVTPIIRIHPNIKMALSKNRTSWTPSLAVVRWRCGIDDNETVWILSHTAASEVANTLYKQTDRRDCLPTTDPPHPPVPPSASPNPSPVFTVCMWRPGNIVQCNKTKDIRQSQTMV